MLPASVLVNRLPSDLCSCAQRRQPVEALWTAAQHSPCAQMVPKRTLRIPGLLYRCMCVPGSGSGVAAGQRLPGPCASWRRAAPLAPPARLRPRYQRQSAFCIPAQLLVVSQGSPCSRSSPADLGPRGANQLRPRHDMSGSRQLPQACRGTCNFAFVSITSKMAC